MYLAMSARSAINKLMLFHLSDAQNQFFFFVSDVCDTKRNNMLTVKGSIPDQPSLR